MYSTKIIGMRDDSGFMPQSDTQAKPLSSDLNDMDVNDTKIGEAGGLTGRCSLLRQIETWLRCDDEDEIISLFVIQLENLSKVKGVLDHSVGELFVSEIISRLNTFNLYSFYLVRLDGNELGFAVRGLPEVEGVWQVASWLEKQFSSPFEVGNFCIFLSPNIGFSVIPYLVEEPVRLVQTATLAACRAKKSTMQSSNFYQTMFLSCSSHNLWVESELHAALRAQNDLKSYYQPKLDLKTNKVVGMEALIRWFHPKKGVISPTEFIPVAEQSQLICDVTDYMLTKVCQDIPRLRSFGFMGPVSINISAKDFNRNNFISDISRILDDYNVHPSDIELEITETALINDIDHSFIVLKILGEKGFGIAIDDFGTGYSSLSYMRKLPVNTLKIDKSLVCNIENSEEVKKMFCALLQLADALNLKVVAEGVENARQKEVIEETSCDLIQGYLLSKPRAIENVYYMLHKLKATKFSDPISSESLPKLGILR